MEARAVGNGLGSDGSSAEYLLDLVKETFREGFFPSKRCELLQELLLPRREMGGRFHHHPHVLVSLAVALNISDTSPF